MGSVVSSGGGFGSIIWIPLQTAYVNPDNVPAVEVDGEDDRWDFKFGGLGFQLTKPLADILWTKNCWTGFRAYSCFLAPSGPLCK